MKSNPHINTITCLRFDMGLFWAETCRRGKKRTVRIVNYIILFDFFVKKKIKRLISDRFSSVENSHGENIAVPFPSVGHTIRHLADQENTHSADLTLARSGCSSGSARERGSKETPVSRISMVSADHQNPGSALPPALMFPA